MMRSCFKSQFRLFRGSDVITPGEWTFAPPGTPAYPGFHWLGSRDYTSDERQPWPELGELPGNVRKWSNGRPPAVFPPAVLLGSANCIARGETPGDVAADLVDGFDSRCYLHFPVPPGPDALFLDVREPGFQRALAEIQAWLYTDPNHAGQLMQLLLGPAATVTVRPNNSTLIPGTVIGVRGNLTVVVVSGTANYQQGAMQGLLSFGGPTNYGVYGTNSLWQLAAQVTQNAILNAGGDQSGPVILVGHSYGGAVASVLTAQYLNANPARPVQLLTFGTPLPGDSRLVELMRPAIQVNFVNNGDPITAVPPTGPLLTAMSWFVPAPIRPGWDQWQYPPGRTGLDTTGNQTANPNPNDLFGVTIGVVRDAVLGQPIESFSAHNMDEYLLRLGGTKPPEADVITGSILAWGAATTPAGYLRCDGSAVSRTTWSQLFAVIGVTWGPGDGSTTFNLPDLRGRAIIGDGQGAGLTLRTVGELGGEELHQLVKAEMPTHSHAGPGGDAFVTNNALGTEYLHAGGDKGGIGTPTDVEGGDGPHNNMQPYGVARWVIKA